MACTEAAQATVEPGTKTRTRHMYENDTHHPINQTPQQAAENSIT